MVSGSPFTLLFGVLFTFPSQYWFTIGLSVVFSLTGWCRQIQTGRLRPRPTQDSTSHHLLPVRGYHPLRPAFPCSSSQIRLNYVVLLPLSSLNYSGLGSCAFARHYWRNHCCFLLLQVLRCFSSLGLLATSLQHIRPSARWVTPFGHPRIISYSRSPQFFAAYHVLLRL